MKKDVFLFRQIIFGAALGKVVTLLYGSDVVLTVHHL